MTPACRRPVELLEMFHLNFGSCWLKSVKAHEHPDTSTSEVWHVSRLFRRQVLKEVDSHWPPDVAWMFIWMMKCVLGQWDVQDLCSCAAKLSPMVCCETMTSSFQVVIMFNFSLSSSFGASSFQFAGANNAAVSHLPHTVSLSLYLNFLFHESWSLTQSGKPLLSVQLLLTRVFVYFHFCFVPSFL